MQTLVPNILMAENHIPLAHVNLEFNRKNTPIDYYQLTPSIVNPSEDEVFLTSENYVDLNLRADEYLSVDHLNIDHDKKETIVLNLPVGKGKTNVCYDLIRKIHADGY